MVSSIDTFAQLLAPMKPEVFFAEYFGRKPCYIPGPPHKFRGTMTWDVLSDLTSMTGIWSSESLMMVSHTEKIPPQAYCVAGVDRRQANSLNPDPARVTALLRQGASLVLNRLETLTPALRGLARVLEETLHAHTQINLYCSWENNKAFRPHEDTHDVFALHCEGEKDWVVYEGMAPLPINHPDHKLTPDQREAIKGRPLMQVTMTPGDVLYIPRGQLHDALAREGCVHLACGTSRMLGMDLVTLVWRMALADPLFRSDVPAADGPTAGDQGAYLGQVGERLARLVGSDAFREAVADYQKANRAIRGEYRFPVTPEDKAAAE